MHFRGHASVSCWLLINGDTYIEDIRSLRYGISGLAWSPIFSLYWVHAYYYFIEYPKPKRQKGQLPTFAKSENSYEFKNVSE